MTTASSASEGPGTGPVRRGRATRRQAVLGTLLVGGAALASVAPTWVVAGTRSALDDAVPIAVRGADAAPATAAGALVVVAGALALALAGRWGVRVAAVGVGLGGVLVTAAALAVARAPEGPARAAALDTVGVATLTDPAGTTPLPWVAAALGLVAVVAAVLAALAADRWAPPGARHERAPATPPAAVAPTRPQGAPAGGPVRRARTAADDDGRDPGADDPARSAEVSGGRGPATRTPPDDQDVWDALTRGEDPT